MFYVFYVQSEELDAMYDLLQVIFFMSSILVSSHAFIGLLVCFLVGILLIFVWFLFFILFIMGLGLNMEPYPTRQVIYR